MTVIPFFKSSVNNFIDVLQYCDSITKTSISSKQIQITSSFSNTPIEFNL